MSKEYDWSGFTVRINIEASKEAIYEAWSNQEMMELWFLRLASFTDAAGNARSRFDKIAEGDTYQWMWHGYPDSSDERGTIMEANGVDRIQFSFGKAGNCTVTISEMEGENIIAIQQDSIPEDEPGKRNFFIGCQLGWTFYLTNLKSLLEGGIDLRNRNEKLKGVLNS